MYAGLHPLLQKSALKWLRSPNETNLAEAPARLVAVHLLRAVGGREAAEITARGPAG